MSQLNTKKVNLTSSNLSEKKLAELRRILPEAFSEEKIDWDKLRTVLGDDVDAGIEKFGFTWAGKSNAIKNVLIPSKATLTPATDESVKFDESENFFIEGDNLEVLKLLQKAYFEKVKMIYIDPPYNTGGDFVYKDNFVSPVKNYLEQTGQIDSEGNKLSTNKETNGRYHSDWLSMMYPRLKLAWNLLCDDGVIFVSIDDNEVHRLRMVMDEVFGEENFIANVIWHNNVKGRQMDLHIKNTYESVLVYSKYSDKVQVNTHKESVDTTALEQDEISFYEKDYPLHNGTSEFHINNRPNLAYSIYYSPESGDAKTIDEKIEIEGK
jgi:adenine-specific DNA-methyltransferase